MRDRDPALCPPELAHEMFEIQNTIVIFAQDFISNQLLFELPQVEYLPENFVIFENFNSMTVIII